MFFLDHDLFSSLQYLITSPGIFQWQQTPIAEIGKCILVARATIGFILISWASSHTPKGVYLEWHSETSIVYVFLWKHVAPYCRQTLRLLGARPRAIAISLARREWRENNLTQLRRFIKPCDRLESGISWESRTPSDRPLEFCNCFRSSGGRSPFLFVVDDVKG